MSQPITYHGWQRVNGTWQRVGGLEGTKGDVHAALLARAELINHGDASPEYLIIPAGKAPGWGDYNTRELRARR